MITTCVVLPAMLLPVWVTELVTVVAIYVGTVVGPLVLLPGPEFQPLPHAGAWRLEANPLKLLGAAQALGWLLADHCAPQNVALARGWRRGRR